MFNYISLSLSPDYNVKSPSAVDFGDIEETAEEDEQEEKTETGLICLTSMIARWYTVMDKSTLFYV